MSWNTHMRKVRDESRPIGSRYTNLGSCVLGFSCLTHGSFHAIWRRLLASHPGSAPPIPGCYFVISSADLHAWADSLESERNLFLSRVRALATKRRLEKGEGRRHPSKADLDLLFAAGVAERSEARAEFDAFCASRDRPKAPPN